MKGSQRGFSLMEIMAAVVLLGIFSTIALKMSRDIIARRATERDTREYTDFEEGLRCKLGRGFTRFLRKNITVNNQVCTQIQDDVRSYFEGDNSLWADDPEEDGCPSHYAPHYTYGAGGYPASAKFDDQTLTALNDLDQRCYAKDQGLGSDQRSLDFCLALSGVGTDGRGSNMPIFAEVKYLYSDLSGHQQVDASLEQVTCGTFRTIDDADPIDSRIYDPPTVPIGRIYYTIYWPVRLGQIYKYRQRTNVLITDPEGADF